MQKKLVENKESGVESINLRLDEYRNNSYLTHNYHPYPAKFIPQIPAEIILKLSKENDWVLDPFCGSGTNSSNPLINCPLFKHSLDAYHPSLTT